MRKYPKVWSNDFYTIYSSSGLERERDKVREDREAVCGVYLERCKIARDTFFWHVGRQRYFIWESGSLHVQHVMTGQWNR